MALRDDLKSTNPNTRRKALRRLVYQTGVLPPVSRVPIVDPRALKTRVSETSEDVSPTNVKVRYSPAIL